jgi:hypothetical protein
MMVAIGTSLRLATWPSHSAVCLREYGPCPFNAIVSFTFYRLVAWFNDRYSQAMALQSKNQLWAPKPMRHLAKAEDRACTHEVECFDHTTGKYEVTERGGITSDGDVWHSRSYVVILIDFSCSVGEQGVRPGHTGLVTWHTSPRIRDGTWSTLYICCNYS